MRYSKTRKSFPVEHPDGGLFYLRPFGAKESFEHLMSLIADEIITDGSGNIVYNSKTGAPAMRTRQDINALVKSAIQHVDRFERVIDDDTGEPMECNYETIALLVSNYIGTVEREIDVPVLDDEGLTRLDDKKQPVMAKEKREFPQPLFDWVLKETNRLTTQIREVQRKN